MNCKQGDLAIYVGEAVFAVEFCTGIKMPIVREGMIFSCMAPAIVMGKPGWEIDMRHVNLVWTSGRTFETDVWAISDDCLRPIRDSEGEDEVLRLVGRPVGAPQSA